MIQPVADLHFAYLLVTAKSHLRAAGWSYRSAATRLGVTFQHVCYVLNGQRHSASLLAKIIALPVLKTSETRSKVLTVPNKTRKSVKATPAITRRGFHYPTKGKPYPMPATITAHQDLTNRLLLCRALLADCAGYLDSDLLYSAGEFLSVLIAETATSHAVARSLARPCRTFDRSSVHTDLDRIGAALPALLRELQARQCADPCHPSCGSSSAHPTTPGAALQAKPIPTIGDIRPPQIRTS